MKEEEGWSENVREQDVIVNELNAAQGPAVDIGGYYQPNDSMASAAMRPSATFNRLLDGS